MAKIRFKSIFDRMLFLQCVTVLSLLLILGLGIGYVARMQGLSMEKEALIETARQAASTLEAGETPQSLQPLTEGKKLLIQVLYPDGIVSVKGINLLSPAGTDGIASVPSAQVTPFRAACQCSSSPAVSANRFLFSNSTPPAEATSRYGL